MFPRPSPPAKLIKMPLRVDALAFNICVLYVAVHDALKLFLAAEKTSKVELSEGVEEGVGKAPNYVPAKSLVLYRLSNTLWENT